MTNTKKVALGVAIVAILVIGVAMGFPKSDNVGGGAHYQKESFQEGLYAGFSRQLEITRTGVINTSGIANFNAGVVLNAGQLLSYTNASSSVTTGTLKESDLLGYDTILATPTGAAATKTLTFPATSTLTSFVPNAGDRQDLCFFNATTTAATTITFAAGTGIDLETSSSTPTDLILLADNMGCFSFLRKTNTDIVAAFTEYADAD
jgi:hypothetical protein